MQIPNKTKLQHTVAVVKDIEERTSLTRGEILIKLVFFEMTPDEIVDEWRQMEEANWSDCAEFGGLIYE